MATPLAPLKFWIAYLNSPSPKTLLFARKSFRFLAQNWSQCNFGLFLPKFGCHGNSLGSLENWDSMFEVADPKTWLFMRKIPRFLAQNWNQCSFGLFLFKFGCHGNSLGSLKNSGSVLKFPSPKIPAVHQKNFSISCRELMSAIFCPNLVAMATAWLPWNFIYHIWIRRPRKPFNYEIKSSISCTELKSVQFWLIFA